jgi:hypothetical protein
VQGSATHFQVHYPDVTALTDDAKALDGVNRLVQHRWVLQQVSAGLDQAGPLLLALLVRHPDAFRPVVLPDTFGEYWRFQLLPGGLHQFQELRSGVLNPELIFQMFGKIVPGFGPGQVHLILVKKVARLE